MRRRTVPISLATAAAAILTSVQAAVPPAAQAAPVTSAAAVSKPLLSTIVAPGGNFDLSVWELQELVGSPGSLTTIPSSRLQDAGGYQDAYFSTDSHDGAAPTSSGVCRNGMKA